ncbi:sensor histidine kinase [Kiloniella sp.]|uniref:sensor histidine kinase n=1 Tax=Kiloniella sp. TaxID=1938587 RepID=UPI003A8DF083
MKKIDTRPYPKDEPTQQSYPHISISDTGIGIGMNPTAHFKLQQPFARMKIDPHLTQEGMGLGIGLSMGLGLTIVKSLIEAHHGAMEIESRLGKRTTVHLYIPL